MTKNIQELLENEGNFSKQPEALHRVDNVEITLASISPILGKTFDSISEECKSQSMYYLSELFGNQSWAKKSTGSQVTNETMAIIWIIYFLVFNSNGKRPNGLMSYFFDECTARSHTNPSPCPYDDLNYPLGHQLSMGSFAVRI